MADSDVLMSAVADVPGLELLVVNPRSAALAGATRASSLVALLAASETFAERNTRMSVQDGIDQLAEITRVAQGSGKRCVATVSTAFGCAYEGAVSASSVARVVDGALTAGLDEVTLCDTAGMAHPSQVHDLVAGVRARFGEAFTLGLHFHDTRGLAIANALAGLDAGVRLFDASVGGLGGCPFSPGASGNVCTEDLVHAFEIEGHHTGVDLDRLIAASLAIEADLGVRLPGQIMRAGPASTAGSHQRSSTHPRS
jgi:hydroxymethylglutaryl-CoA lyase